MAVRVKVAQTAREVDQLFQLRHDVYVDQGGYMEPAPQARLFDRFDALPGTVLMSSEVDERVVGTVRFTRDLGAGTHANDYYDFGPHLPEGARVGSGSMLAVHEGWRGRRRLTFSLVGMCIYHASLAGLTHLLGTVNPEVLDGFLRLGFRPVDGVLIHEPGDLPFVPVILDLDRLEGRIAAFVERQIAWSFLPAHDRLFLSAGDQLSELAHKHEAYYVVGGSVQWIGRGGATAEFHAGDYIGRIDTVLGEPMRTAIATTDVDLVAVPLARRVGRRRPGVADPSVRIGHTGPLLGATVG